MLPTFIPVSHLLYYIIFAGMPANAYGSASVNALEYKSTNISI